MTQQLASLFRRSNRKLSPRQLKNVKPGVMRGKALEMETARLREVNAASSRYREQQNLAGINPLTGRRWGS